MRTLETVQLFAIKWHGQAETCVVVDYVREMTSRKSFKYDECGLFEHFVFLC